MGMPFLGLHTYRASRTALRACQWLYPGHASRPALCYGSQGHADHSVQAKAVARDPGPTPDRLGRSQITPDCRILPHDACLYPGFSAPRGPGTSETRVPNAVWPSQYAHSQISLIYKATSVSWVLALSSLWLNEPDVFARSWCANRVIRSDL